MEQISSSKSTKLTLKFRGGCITTYLAGDKPATLRETDYATTICARESKGVTQFGLYNTIIEIYEVNL